MKQRGIVQNSWLALGGDVSSKLGTLLLMIVAARALSTESFALLATGLATATVLTSALDLGSQTLLTRDGVTGPLARGSLLRSLAVARAPLVLAALALALVLGAASGRLLLAVATVVVGIVGAAQLSLSGALRSAQDLRPEAISKLLSGILISLGGATLAVLTGDGGWVLMAIAAAMVVGSLPLLRAGRRTIALGRRASAWAPLRRALPLGLMGLATLIYYRSGTVALSIVSGAHATAAFGAATMIAWGLLAFANAVTTGLLPRLSALGGGEARAHLTRRALIWSTALAVLLAAIVAAASGPLVDIAYGARYRSAAEPLAILAASTVLIAFTGVLGTALIAAGRVRPVAIQVAVSLVVNLLALAILAPRLGAVGAALATLACELAAVIMLTRPALRTFPGVLAPGRSYSRPFPPDGTNRRGPRSPARGQGVPAQRSSVGSSYGATQSSLG
jgi:O-antigen/teichoic acid export membrane protein